jgi:hypothetical protein
MHAGTRGGGGESPRRYTELEVSFEGFCDIVKAAGERTSRKDREGGAPSPPPQLGQRTGTSQQGPQSLNAVVLEKYKSKNQ